MFCHKNHFRDPDHRQKAPAFQSAKRYVTGLQRKKLFRLRHRLVPCKRRNPCPHFVREQFEYHSVRYDRDRLFGCGIPQSIARVVQSFYFFPFPILHKLYRNLTGVFQEHLLSDLQQEERSRIPGISSRNRRYALPIRKPDSI